MIFDSRRQSPFGINIIRKRENNGIRWWWIWMQTAQSKEQTSVKSGNCVQPIPITYMYLYVFLAIVVVKIFKKGCHFLTNVNFSYDTKHHTANCAGAHNLNHFKCVVHYICAWDQKLKQNSTISILCRIFFFLNFPRMVNDHVRRCLQNWRRCKLSSHRSCGLTKSAFRNDVNYTMNIRI